ncbi:hypothetical protein [Micromonospora sp. NPDC004704]
MWKLATLVGATGSVLVLALGASTSPPVRSLGELTGGSAVPGTAPDDVTASVPTRTTDPERPHPPQLPADFRGAGRYLVPDLGIDVPFTWQGKGGDSQMIAGGPEHPIWFTNLIYRNTLYTLTYKWPNIPLDPPRPCDRIPGIFNREILNAALRTARFVGPEVLQGAKDRYVDHWRVGVVGGSTKPGEFFRFPIALGDVYVDQGNPSQWWQVLQFGFQNLFDPQLDEWFTMTTFSHLPGQVTLPARCPAPTPPDNTWQDGQPLPAP